MEERLARRSYLEWNAGAVRLRVQGEPVLVGSGSGRTPRPVEAGAESVGRGAQFSGRLAAEWRFRMFGLPWEMLNPNPVLVTFTYPARHAARLVPDGRRLEAHRTAMLKRWERAGWGPVLGVWRKEFTRRGTPHLHLYTGLRGVSKEDIKGLEAITEVGQTLESELGRYDGRRETPALFSYVPDWGYQVSVMWGEVIGTAGLEGRERREALSRGVQARTFYYARGRERRYSALRVVEYMVGEIGKMSQSRAPEAFGPVGRWIGLLGESRGFAVSNEWMELPPRVAREVEIRLCRWVAWKLSVKNSASRMMSQRRWGSGITARGFPVEKVSTLLRYSYAAAERKEREETPVLDLRERQRPQGGDYFARNHNLVAVTSRVSDQPGS